jgi:hypothetical protein
MTGIAASKMLVKLITGGLNLATSFGEWPHICALFKVSKETNFSVLD